jgi:ubiquinone/menaquinone biosynthesis C-methylase UbiE
VNEFPKRSSQEQFDRQAPKYDATWSSWSDETLQWMLEHAALRPSDVVLDVATGNGFTALAFAPHVSHVTGLDVSPGMLAQARTRASEASLGNMSFVEGSAESMPFEDGSFDIVTCRIAPHHFLSLPAFLSESARVLRPGGRLIVGDTSVPDDMPEADAWQNGVEALRDPSHVRNYTPSEWRGMVTEAGFEIDTLTDEGGGVSVPFAFWIDRAGCGPELAEAVRREFETAPAAVAEVFKIGGVDGSVSDISFVWRRVVLAARVS